MSLNSRTVAIIVHDVLAAVVAWLGGYWLRFNLSGPAECLAWLADAGFHDEATVKRQLKTWVPEYQPRGDSGVAYIDVSGTANASVV